MLCIVQTFGPPLLFLPPTKGKHSIGTFVLGLLLCKVIVFVKFFYMRKVIGLVFLWTLSLIITTVRAQQTAFEWVRKYDTTGNGRDIAVDGAGNVYAGGLASGTPVIYKLDEAGNTLWKKYFTRITDGSTELKGIYADKFNNLYVAGYFSGAVDFDPGNDTVALEAKGTIASSFNGYIVKLDTAGNFIWARQLGAGARQCYINDIAIDNWGNIITTGRYVGTGDFNPGADTFALSNNSANTSLHNIFISKLDAGGNFIWAMQFTGSAGVSDGIAITTDGLGNVITGGSFRNTMNFDPGNANIILTVLAGVDGYIAKLDSSGHFRWVKHLAGQSTGTSNAREIYDIVADKQGQIYATGYFSHTANFDVGASNQVLTAVSGYDAIVAKYDSSGTLTWIRQFGGFAGDIGRGIALDNDRNVYTVGTFSDSVNFDPGNGNYYLKTKNNANAFYTDVYFSKLDNEGRFLWAKSMGGKQIDQGDRIAIDSSRNIYTVGYFQSDSCDFDPDPARAYILSVLPPPIPQFPQLLNNEIFIHKLGCADTVSSEQVVNACAAYTFGDEVWEQSGIYERKLRAVSGCDSTVTIDLRIQELNVIINVNGFILSTSQSYSAYQWIMNGVLILGATGASYEVTENGQYQVIIQSEYGCSDTSAVYEVSNVGTSIARPGSDSGVPLLYPNPTKGEIQIRGRKEVCIHLSTIEGRIIKTVCRVNSFSLAGMPQGVYIVRIEDENGRLLKTEKLVKQ